MFILENTQNVHNFKCYQRATTILLNQGYDILRINVNASKCGSPQSRTRVLQIAIVSSKEIKTNILTCG